jgi:hypothetical protein
MQLIKKSNDRKKTLEIRYILGFILIIMLIVTSCVIIRQTLVVKYLQKSVNELQKSLDDLQTFSCEKNLELNDKSIEKIFFTQMESQYNSFKDNVTIVMTLTVVLIGSLSIIVPLYNFFFLTKDILNACENKFLESANVLRNYEDSFNEKILVMEYFYSVNDPYTPKPKLTTDSAKAFFYYVEGDREFKAARASSDNEQRIEYSVRAVDALSKAIDIQSSTKERILLDAKVYHLRASIYMALAETYKDNKKCIENHLKAHDDITKGLEIFNNEPRLLFAQCANNIALYEHGKRKYLFLNNFDKTALENISFAIDNTPPDAHYFYIRALLRKILADEYRKKLNKSDYNMILDDITKAQSMCGKNKLIAKALDDLEREIKYLYT